jgi:hypothetical protein
MQIVAGARSVLGEFSNYFPPASQICPFREKAFPKSVIPFSTGRGVKNL